MDYQRIIMQTGTVLVEFYATWCPHCRRMMPVVQQVRELLSGQADVVQIDIDKYPAIAAGEEIDATPTFILYRNGRQVWRHSGEIEGEALLARVERSLSGF